MHRAALASKEICVFVSGISAHPNEPVAADTAE